MKNPLSQAHYTRKLGYTEKEKHYIIKSNFAKIIEYLRLEFVEERMSKELFYTRFSIICTIISIYHSSILVGKLIFIFLIMLLVFY